MNNSTSEYTYVVKGEDLTTGEGASDQGECISQYNVNIKTSHGPVLDPNKDPSYWPSQHRNHGFDSMANQSFENPRVLDTVLTLPSQRLPGTGGYYAEPTVKQENHGVDTSASTVWASNFWLDFEQPAPEATPERVPTLHVLQNRGPFWNVEEHTMVIDKGYLLPNDGQEQDRLDMQHAQFYVAFDGELSLAPIGEPAKVLDIATGTGTWALDFAQKYPRSQVIGTDLSLIQPPVNIHNCSFVREDSEELWVHDTTFDYIHMRQTLTCFDNDMAVINQAFDHLEEGGWMEIQDGYLQLESIDGTTEGTAVEKFIDFVHQGFQTFGRDVLKARFYKQWLIQAGFIDVCEQRLPVPINTWPVDAKFKQLGKLQNANFHAALEPFAIKELEAGLGFTPTEAHKLAQEAGKIHSDKSIHGYCSIYVVYGRKPFAWEQVPAEEPQQRS